jgi:hypothetical protein
VRGTSRFLLEPRRLYVPGSPSFSRLTAELLPAAGFTNLNQLDKVVEDCTNALRLDPSYIKALNRRATAREQIGGVENLYLALCGTSSLSLLLSGYLGTERTRRVSNIGTNRFHRCGDYRQLYDSSDYRFGRTSHETTRD